MSIIGKLDRDKFTNLLEILDSYDIKMKDWKSHVNIDGKNIQSANIEQASWLAYYDEIRVELKTLLDFFDMKIREVRGNVARLLMSKEDHSLNERTRERYIDADPKYIKTYQLFLEVQEIYNLADSIVKQFTQRAYVLNNLVKIHMSAIQDVTLFLD